MIITPLLPAWLLDLILGDPERLPHPVVYMGKWIAMGERCLNQGKHRMAKGAAFAVVSIVGTGLLMWWLMYGARACCEWLSFGISSLLIFFCLAGKTLRREVRMVFEALERGLDEGRRQVGRIVGRDTQQLSAQEVRTAALETLAENLSDGVIAPLFWWALLGVPGIMAYKMVNTLDSMIGYHSPRYKDFGCWAARIDDFANYIPARLTALLIATVGAMYSRRSLLQAWRFTLKYGPQHASPNSGWPEAALAATLDCRFGGPHEYFGETFPKPFIGHNPRTLTLQDMRLSIRVCFISELIFILILWLIS